MKRRQKLRDIPYNKQDNPKEIRSGERRSGGVVADLIFNYTYIIPYGYGEVKRFLCPESPF
jgi:hypothetical protein